MGIRGKKGTFVGWTAFSSYLLPGKCWGSNIHFKSWRDNFRIPYSPSWFLWQYNPLKTFMGFLFSWIKTISCTNYCTHNLFETSQIFLISLYFLIPLTLFLNFIAFLCNPSEFSGSTTHLVSFPWVLFF